MAAWLSTAKTLLPMQRRLEQGIHDWTTDTMMHLLMPGVCAVGELRSREFWSVLFAESRRHVLVALPPDTALSYFAPSYLFAVPHGFDDEALEKELSTLPTSAHVERAREVMRKSGASSPA